MQQIELHEKEETVDLRTILGKYFQKWPWFVLSIFLFLIGAYIYIRYSVPKYQSQTTLKFDKKQNDISSALADLDNLGIGLGNADELKSEIAVITSRPILGRVVENLNLNVQYYNEGEIKDFEIFDNSAVTAKIIQLNNDKKFIKSEFTLKLNNEKEFTLTDSKGQNFKGFFNQPLKLHFGFVILQLNRNIDSNEKYKIVFSNPLEKIKDLERRLTVDLPDQKALLINISIVGGTPDKSEAILNEVTKQYNLDGLRDKNLQAKNTQEFIDKRLEVITNDLSGVENQKENFQNKNQIVDLEAQAKMALENTNDNTKALLQQRTQLELLNALEREASQNGLMPSNLGLSLSLDQAINQYNSLLISRNKTLKQATNENPAVIEMNKEISSLKDIVRDNIRQQKATLQTSIGQLNGQISTSKGIIEKVPGNSKVYRGIERQQNLKEQLFLFLLQKREENAINLSVNVPKAKIVNPAFTNDIPVSPKRAIIFLGAVLLGILFPFGFIYSFSFWDDKIYSRQDLKGRSSHAVLADIPSLKDKVDHLVKVNDFSELAEAFRVLVSNLKFVLPTKDTAKVIMVTSSIKGEGKTLVSVNLALTLGLKNKRALLIGSDIRNPQIQRYDNERVNWKGLTEYLYDDSIQINELIHITDSNPNCDVIYAGTIPPNPQELLSNGKYQKLIEELSRTYAYIIIDSAPLMLVSDTLSIADSADATIYVLRSGVTRNLMVDFAGGLVKDSKLSNLSFVINDVSKNSGGYGYNYGYGYGYTNDRKESWWKKIVNKVIKK